jgi:hypothetical protein
MSVDFKKLLQFRTINYMRLLCLSQSRYDAKNINFDYSSRLSAFARISEFKNEICFLQ